MKLRTVLYELACADWRMGREGILDEDVLLTPEYETNVPPKARLLRVVRLFDFRAGSVRPGQRPGAMMQPLFNTPSAQSLRLT